MSSFVVSVMAIAGFRCELKAFGVICSRAWSNQLEYPAVSNADHKYCTSERSTRGSGRADALMSGIDRIYFLVYLSECRKIYIAFYYAHIGTYFRTYR